jgi:membrane protein required for colicin V production
VADLTSWLNPFDVLIVLALLAGVALGFVRGLVRMILSLLVLYLAAVAAMTLYTSLGNWLRVVAGLPLSLSQSLSFLVILILISAAINFVLRRTYKHTELPGVRQIDQLGGMIVGFFLSVVWIGLSILIIAFFLRASLGQEAPIQQTVIGYFRRSSLIPVFYRVLPVILATLRPWMPKGLPPEIFTFRL